MLGLKVISKAKGIFIPPGEQLLSTAGTGNWTVPEGVTSICVAGLGAGGDGIQRTGFGGSWVGGGGGGLFYKNNIAVTPGQVIAYQVSGSENLGGLSSTTILGMTATRGQRGIDGAGNTFGGIASGGDANYSGGGSTSRTGGTVMGGGAATLTGNGANETGNGTVLGTSIGISPRGAGGYSVHSPSAPSNGQIGLIRIIWGTGRTFPTG